MYVLVYVQRESDLTMQCKLATREDIGRRPDRLYGSDGEGNGLFGRKEN